MHGLHGRRLWAAGAAALGLWMSLTGAGVGAAGPVPGAGATAATPLGLGTHVALSADAAYPSAFVLASHDASGGTELEVSVCESQESCARYTAVVRGDSLVDVGGEHNVVMLLADVAGLGQVRLRFASAGTAATSPVGCAGSRAGAVMQAEKDAGRVELGAVTGVVGEREVRSLCAVGGRKASVVYAFTPTPPEVAAG